MIETTYQLVHRTPNGASICIMETTSKTEAFKKYDNILGEQFKGSILIIKKQIFIEKIAESYDERQMVLGIWNIMTIHEIITLLGIALPIAYSLGRMDESGPANDDFFSVVFIVLFFSSFISAAVAITLRFVN